MSAAPPIPRRVDLGAVTVLVGHVLDVLADVADASVQTIVTSPPYWGLRDYGCAPIDWPAVEYSPIWYLPPVRVEAMRCALGLEPDVASFVAHMVLVFGGLRRVLRDDGTCWVNLGSSYATGTQADRKPSMTPADARDGRPSHKPAGWTNRCQGTRRSPESLAAKQLVHAPSILALALQADGWIWRSEVIWQKPNPMPESVTDRPTVSHEQVLLFAKSPRYFYDATAIREPDSGQPAGNGFAGRQGGARNTVVSGGIGSTEPWQPGAGRNARNVWTIPPAPYRGAHFATFPPALAERCILAGTSARGCCAACGAPWRREVEREFVPQADVSPERGVRGAAGQKHLDATNGRDGYQTTTTGWRPSCGCVGARVVPCAVLDPFGGSGTTGAAAKTLGRAALLCEAQPEYLPLIARRVAEAPAYQPALDLGGVR